MNAKDCKPGTRVKYRPIINKDPAFVGTVREEPWFLGDGTLVTHVVMGNDYAAWRGGSGEMTVYGASVRHLEAA
jgi:hypothetical protein